MVPLGSDVLLVPGLEQDLVQACRKYGYSVVFDADTVKICSPGSVTLTADPVISGNLNACRVDDLSDLFDLVGI